MANEYQVLFGAKLDQASLDNAVKNARTSEKLTISNFRLDTASLTTQIQNALRNINLDISFSRNAGNIVGEAQKVGQQVGEAISRGTQSSLRAIDLRSAVKEVKDVREILQDSKFKFSIGGIDAAEAQLRQLSVLFGTLKTEITKNNTIRLNITGMNEAGNSVEIIEEFNAMGERVRNSVVKTKAVLNDFGSAITEATSQAKKAKHIQVAIDTKDIEKATSTVRGLYGNIEKSGHSSLSALRNDLIAVEQAQQALLNVSGGSAIDLVQAYEVWDNAVRKLQNDLSITATELGNVPNIQSRMSTGELDAQLSALNQRYMALQNTGHNALGQINLELQNAAQLHQQLNAELLEFQRTGNVGNINQTYERLTASLETARQGIRTISAETKMMASTLQIQTLDAKIANWMSKNTAAAKDFGGQINNLRNRLAELNRSGNATTAQLKAIENEFQAVKNTAITAGKVGKSFASSFKGALQSISRYVSASMLIYRGIAMMRQMYQNTLAVDTAMTGLYRVTDLTAEEYTRLYDKMKNSAKEYGATLKDTIDLTTSWVKLGYSADEAQNLAGITTMYQHVTDIDTETATKHLITAYKGFQQSLDETYQGDTAKAINFTADVYDKLNNEFAVTASDIGEAMQRSASALGEANNTFEESTGLATGMIEVIQNAEKAGTTLQTTSLRLRGMKGRLEELGEDVDENVESISQMQTHILNLTNGEVNIFNDDGSFKSTYEILKEISEIYDSLSDPKKADLLETVAGKRNANSIAAVIRNFSQVEKATEAARNATGTAEQENAKYLNSMQGKLNQFQASWEALSTSMADSSFLKGLIEGGTGVLDFFGGLIDKIGLIPVVIGGAFAAMSFKNIGRDKSFSL